MTEFESDNTPETILARVKESLPSPWEWRRGGAHTRTPFYGKVKADGFWVMKGKSRFEKNSFNPVLVAWVRPSQRGSRVTAKVRVPLPVQVFLAAWCVGVIVICGMGFYESLTSEAASDRVIAAIFVAAIPILLGVAGILFVVAQTIGRQRQPELERWLRNIVEEGKSSFPRID